MLYYDLITYTLLPSLKSHDHPFPRIEISGLLLSVALGP